MKMISRHFSPRAISSISCPSCPSSDPFEFSHLSISTSAYLSPGHSLFLHLCFYSILLLSLLLIISLSSIARTRAIFQTLTLSFLVCFAVFFVRILFGSVFVLVSNDLLWISILASFVVWFFGCHGSVS